MKFGVKNKSTNDVQFTAEIDCDENRSFSFKLGLAIKWGFKFGADLKGADLKGANLEGANLEGADLEGADLDIPIIKDIHKKVYEVINQKENVLDMSTWHTCKTTHCRAGWVVTLAGEKGRELENKIGTAAAAYAIYWKSDPEMEKARDFYCDNETAMEDIKKMAGVSCDE